MRLLLAVLLTLCWPFAAQSQDLPWFLLSHFPQAGATNVPLNARFVFLVTDQVQTSERLFTLRQGTREIPLQLLPGNMRGSLVLQAPALEPNTTYQGTLRRDFWSTEQYVFSFTTGTTRVTDPPRLVGLEPAPQEGVVGWQGPFTVRFDRPVQALPRSDGRQAITVRNQQGGLVAIGQRSTADGRGVIVEFLTQNELAGVEVTVDPAGFADYFGNAASGAPVVARYRTFLQTVGDGRGPQLVSHFPARGEGGLPRNVSVRLLFDRTIDYDSAQRAVRLEADGQAIPVQLDRFAGDRGLAVSPTRILAANTTHRIVISPALLDANFRALEAEQTIEFVTGGEADVSDTRLLSVQPASTFDTNDDFRTVPLNVVIRAQANKRIMPVSVLPVRFLASRTGRVAVEPALSEDGRTLTVTPLEPLQPSMTYTLDWSGVVSITGASFLPPLRFTTGVEADTEPPRVTAVSPPDGATGVPASTVVQVRWSEWVSGAALPGTVVLRRDDQAMAATLELDDASRMVTVRPSAGLLPDTAYTLEVGSVTDAAGNRSEPRTVRFTTGTTPLPPPQLVEALPAAEAEGVDVNTRITLRFNVPLNEAGPLTNNLGAQGFPWAHRVEISGNVVTMTPQYPLPPNATVDLGVQVRDLTGRIAFGGTTFTTGSSSDTERPEVIAMSPAAGSTVTGWQQTIVLTLSKPVHPGTVSANTVRLFSGGLPQPQSLPRLAADGRSISIRNPLMTPGELTVVAAGIKDVADNPLVPFRASFRSVQGPPAALNGAQVREMRPDSSLRSAPADSPVTWFLQEPLRVRPEGRLFVLADGQVVPGSFAVSADERVLTFRPASPLPGGGRVTLYQTEPVLQLSSSWTFLVDPAAPADRWQIRRVTPEGETAPGGGVIEVEFNQDAPLGRNLVALFTTDGSSGQLRNPLPFRESQPRPRVLRLTPLTPLPAGRYQIVPALSVSVIPAASRAFSFTVPAAGKAAAALALDLVSPAQDATEVPRNARLGFRLSQPVNPLTITAASVVVRAGGRELAVIRTVDTELRSDQRTVRLLPLEELPPFTRIEVSVQGVEDRLGRLLPAQSWSFTTGNELDYTEPRSTASPTGPGEPPQAAPGAVFRFAFDEPIDVTTLRACIAENCNFSLPSPDLLVTFSPDRRAVMVQAAEPLPLGRILEVVVRAEDLCGNRLSGWQVSARFQAAFENDPTPPELLAVSPAAGSTGMPLNAAITLRFNKQVDLASLSRVRLVSSDGELATRVQMSWLERMVLLFPAQPLLPNTAYEVRVEGVRDLFGNTVARSTVYSFTTGETFDESPTTGTYVPGSNGTLARNMNIQVRLNKPVNAASVSSDAIRLTEASAERPARVIPLEFRIAADGRTVTAVPLVPLRPGQSYSFTARLLDLLGARVQLSGSNDEVSFRFSGEDDTTPPRITLFPPDGSTDIPVNVQLRYTVNEPLDPAVPVEVRLWEGDRFTRSRVSGLTISPPLQWRPGATYRLELSGATDLAGNTAAPVSATFRMADTNAWDTRPPRLVSTLPADQAADVPGDAPVRAVFSKLLGPVLGWPARISTTPPSLARGTWSVEGNTLVFTPLVPFLAGSLVEIVYERRRNFGLPSLTDLAGNLIDREYLLRFRVATRPDNEPPRLLSVSPEPGSTVRFGNPLWQLRFSEPVLVNNESLRVFVGSRAVNTSAYMSQQDPAVVLVSASVERNSTVTLVGTDGVTDLAGNRLEPFAFTYEVDDESGGSPTVESVTPGNFANNVAPDVPVEIRFSRRMNPLTVLNAVRLTQNGALVRGSLRLTGGDRLVVFGPEQPLAPGARIDVFVETSATSVDGQPLPQRFTSQFLVRAATAPTAVVRTSFAGPVAPAASLEVEFSADLDRATVHEGTVGLAANGRLVPLRAAAVSARVVRVTPAEPLTPGTAYVLSLGPGQRTETGRELPPVTLPVRVAATAAEPPTVAEVLAGELGGRPVLRVRFTGAVSPVSAGGLTVLSAQGEPVPAHLLFAPDGREWLVQPQDAALPLDGLQVQLHGVLNAAGHTLAPVSKSVRREETGRP